MKKTEYRSFEEVYLEAENILEKIIEDSKKRDAKETYFKYIIPLFELEEACEKYGIRNKFKKEDHNDNAIEWDIRWLNEAKQGRRNVVKTIINEDSSEEDYVKALEYFKDNIIFVH